MPHALGLAPSKIIAVHLNYRSKAAERGRTPDAPSYFLKPPSSLASSGDPVVRPRGAHLLSFEGEIALLIGRQAHRVAPEHGLDHVAGYLAANDFGLYDLRYADRGSNLLSKGQDGFTPVGPTLLEAGEVDPDKLTLRTWVNGELVQQDSTADLIFSFGHLVADLSRLITLEPGDLILTGTPAGSRPVEPGDVVEVELGESGRLRSPIVAAEHDLEPYGAMPKASAQARALATGVPEPRHITLSARTAATLREVATATLSSELRKRGIEHSFIEGVRPTRPDLRMVGYARTLRFVALREDVFAERGGGMNAQKRAVEEIDAAEILVIEARGDHGAGTIGDILAMRALRRGAAGVVSDGGLRDSPTVSGLDLPVYYGAPHAAVLGRRHVPMDRDLPVSCGGVLVMPGDVLVGDAEGVIVIPPALVDEVAEAALTREREERYIFERVEAGASIEGLYPLGPGARAEYESWRADQDEA
jgi:2-keto-4-pentenoate hydratase/2-oxohepta-3-ene-1,7-dioic acid hydratase in catechol pathway/regulator of RNase E activity RraA